MTQYWWYRGVGILDPRSRWVPPLGPVGSPDSTKGDLYTYIHTQWSLLTQMLSSCEHFLCDFRWDWDPSFADERSKETADRSQILHIHRAKLSDRTRFIKRKRCCFFLNKVRRQLAAGSLLRQERSGFLRSINRLWTMLVMTSKHHNFVTKNFFQSCWPTRDHIARSTGISNPAWHLPQVVPRVDQI